MRVAAAVPLAKAAAVHVDADEAEEDVAAAAEALGAADQGDDDAQFIVDGAEDHELLWFGVAGDPAPHRLTDRRRPVCRAPGGYLFCMTPGKTRTHLVWDWNGTLFHDIDAVIGATNAAFAELGLEPITLERYRELYCVPVPRSTSG